MATTWATAADVLTITGATVTDDEVQRAQFVVDLYSNRSIAASGQVRTRDLMWLQRAVAFQSAWMLSQPGYYGKSQVTGVAQDGLTAMYADKSAVMLAPLAGRSLKNVSWLRSKSLHVQSPFESGNASGLNDTPAGFGDVGGSVPFVPLSGY